MNRIAVAALAAVVFVITGAAQAAPARRAAAAPDLAVRSVTAPPGAADRLEVQVVTAGGRAAAASVGYYLSADRVRDQRDRRLRVAGKARGGAVALAVPSGLAGRAGFVVACADDRNRVAEPNERNNCASSRRMVGFLQPFRPRPLHVSERLDEARAVTRAIGRGGGTIEATAANGTRFRLAVPARALAADTEITMTPLASVGGIPYPGAVAGAVRLEPAGLLFGRAATLTITPAGALPAAERTPFATDRGRNFHLYPLLPRRPAIELPIFHFSTYGVSRWGTSIQATQIKRVPSDRIGWAEQNLARATARARFQQLTGQDDAGAPVESASYVATYVYGNEVVGPLLEAAATNDAVFDQATQALVTWERQVELFGHGDEATFRDMAARFHELWQKAFVNAARKTVDRCFRGGGPAEAVRLLAFVRTAALLDIDIGESTESVIGCLRFELTFTTRIDSGGSLVSEVRVANVPIEGSLEPPFVNLPVSRPLEYVWRVVDEECDEAGTPVQQRPFSVVDVDLDLDHPGGPDPGHVTLEIDYGYATTPHTSRAAVFDEGRTICEDPVHFPDQGHYALVLGPHLPITGFINRIRITGWRRVGGSTWAIERVYEFDDGTTSVRTRFFLRHAPKR